MLPFSLWVSLLKLNRGKKGTLMLKGFVGLNPRVNPKKLETGLRTISAGIPYTLFLRIEVIGFSTFGVLL